MRAKCCSYCGYTFGTVKHKNGKSVTLIKTEDHFIPHSKNGKIFENIFIACQVCNAIKSNNRFNDINEASEWIAKERKKLGYDF
jgi:5-methylcytosine-specific restriction endonuclease McrA